MMRLIMSLIQRSIMHVLTLIVLLGLTSCTKPAPNTAGVSDLLVITYDSGPGIGIGDNLEFWIKNESDRCISFPVDYGLKLFVKANQTWDQVPNLATYVGEEPNVLESKGGTFSEDAVIARPDVSQLDLAGPTDFYASVTGHLCDDGSVIVEKEIPFTVTP